MSALQSGGIKIWIAYSPLKITSEAMAHGSKSMNVARIRRHFLNGVPDVWESMSSSLERAFSSGFSGEFRARTKNAAMMAPSESTPRIGK